MKGVYWWIIVLAVLVIGAVVVGVFVFSGGNSEIEPYGAGDNSGESGSNACLDLGCPAGTVFVGSLNSDKYYECDCRYAGNVLPENIVCFSSGNEAESQGYARSEC